MPNFTMIVNSYTDHVTLTVLNGTFVLDATPASAHHGALQENGQEFFTMTQSDTQLFIQQKDGEFNLLAIYTRVSVPAGTEYLNVQVSGRGGLGDLTLIANLPAQGTVNAPADGEYALPLTSLAIEKLPELIRKREEDLHLIPPPKR